MRLVYQNTYSTVTYWTIQVLTVIKITIQNASYLYWNSACKSCDYLSMYNLDYFLKMTFVWKLYKAWNILISVDVLKSPHWLYPKLISVLYVSARLFCNSNNDSSKKLLFQAAISGQPETDSDVLMPTFPPWPTSPRRIFFYDSYFFHLDGKVRKQSLKCVLINLVSGNCCI